MTNLLRHLEEMRLRLGEAARDERALVQALADALNRLDEQLLRDVRTIGTEHERRRGEILGELRDLADGIGMFRQPVAALQAPEELLHHRRTSGFLERIRINAPGDRRQPMSKAESPWSDGATSIN